MFSKDFWAAACNRAFRTFCQTAIAMCGSAVLLSDINFEAVLSASALAALLSIATSVVTDLPEAPKKG